MSWYYDLWQKIKHQDICEKGKKTYKYQICHENDCTKMINLKTLTGFVEYLMNKHGERIK